MPIFPKLQNRFWSIWSNVKKKSIFARLIDWFWLIFQYFSWKNQSMEEKFISLPELLSQPLFVNCEVTLNCDTFPKINYKFLIFNVFSSVFRHSLRKRRVLQQLQLMPHQDHQLGRDPDWSKCDQHLCVQLYVTRTRMPTLPQNVLSRLLGRRSWQLSKILES